MNKRFIKEKWYWILTAIVLLGELAVFLIAGEQHTYIGVHDNLDIHIADYKLLKDNHAFFKQAMQMPILGGISRDFLLSEFYLYSLIHALLPTFAAYITGYFLKIIIALVGGYLLGKDILGKEFAEVEWIVVLSSLTYGLLPVYPAFSFSFTSIPLLIYIIRRLENSGEKRYFLYLFFYPMISYFTFFGPFIVGYIMIYLIYRSIKNRRIDLKLLLGSLFLCLGYVLIEYRLFRLIFMSGEPTIRDTMAFSNRDALGILKLVFEGFVYNMFHCEDVHRIVVLPIVIISLIVINAGYIKRGEYRQILKNYINLVFIFILFNSLVYGLQECEIVREAFFALVPPLKGWQFDRTIFFNPFLWYLEIALIAIRAVRQRVKAVPPIVVGVTFLVVVGTQTLYNDFYNTIYVNAYRIIKGKESETLSYGEFFSAKLFEEIKADIDYHGEYAVAYGYHPAVLTYNGIATLDACLSHYYQSYKEDFREIIAPALDRSDDAREYFDGWGGRAYIFSPTTESIWLASRTKEVTDHNLYIDPEAFRKLGGRYVFSRIELDNADDLGLILINSYTEASSPYTIWVYKN